MTAHATASRVTLCISAAAALLHLYTAIFKASQPPNGFLVGLVIWSCVPYLIALALARSPERFAIAIGGASAAFLGDLGMHILVFHVSKGSTAAVALVFMPLWNLVLLGPTGAVTAWLFVRFMASRTPSPANTTVLGGKR